jgi:hypothetical protein
MSVVQRRAHASALAAASRSHEASGSPAEVSAGVVIATIWVNT